LASVDYECQTHALAERLVLPQGAVVAGDSLLFVLDGLADLKDLVLHFLFTVSHSSKSGACLLDVVSTFNEPESG
jgi:hypothetical protein